MRSLSMHSVYVQYSVCNSVSVSVQELKRPQTMGYTHVCSRYSEGGKIK